MPGLARGIPHAHCGVCTRQPGQDVAGVGGPPGKDRGGEPRSGSVSRGEPLARRDQGSHPPRPVHLDPRFAARHPQPTDLGEFQQHAAYVVRRRQADHLRLQSRRRLGHLRLTRRWIGTLGSAAEGALRPVSAVGGAGRDGALHGNHPKTSRDMLMLSPDGKTTPLRVTAANEGEARFWHGTFSGSGSAKGWIAYASDESGRREVYVQSHPGAANRIPVSREGGSQPQWSRDGKELFYVTSEAVVAVDFHPDGSFGAPRRLFDRTAFLLNDSRFSNYEASTDGKRFLMIRRDEGSAPHQLNVILNWSGEAERSTAAGNQ